MDGGYAAAITLIVIVNITLLCFIQQLIKITYTHLVAAVAAGGAAVLAHHVVLAVLAHGVLTVTVTASGVHSLYLLLRFYTTRNSGLSYPGPWPPASLPPRKNALRRTQHPTV